MRSERYPDKYHTEIATDRSQTDIFWVNTSDIEAIYHPRIQELHDIVFPQWRNETCQGSRDGPRGEALKSQVLLLQESIWYFRKTRQSTKTFSLREKFIVHRNKKSTVNLPVHDPVQGMYRQDFLKVYRENACSSEELIGRVLRIVYSAMHQTLG